MGLVASWLRKRFVANQRVAKCTLELGTLFGSLTKSPTQNEERFSKLNSGPDLSLRGRRGNVAMRFFDSILLRSSCTCVGCFSFSTLSRLAAQKLAAIGQKFRSDDDTGISQPLLHRCIAPLPLLAASAYHIRISLSDLARQE